MHLRLSGISKRFGAVQAVVDADLEIRPGRVLALLGENGAGKSTLMKLLYGVHRPDAGTIAIDGRMVAITSPRVAMQAAIGMVFQQSSLIPALTVRENLALALEACGWWVGRRARALRALDARLQAIAPGVPAEAMVADLGVSQLQLVELVKLRLREARCVILDEPSAALAPAEAQRLWVLIRALADEGVAVVLITHKLADVRACADEVAVMRAGRVVAQTPVAEADDARIVGWMVGRAPAAVRAPAGPAATQPVRLWIKDVGVGAARGVDLQVRRGEILGVAGISGGGQAELAEAIAGARALDAGEVILDGELLRAPRRALRPSPQLGVIPAEPLRNAVAPTLSLAVNLALKGIGALPLVVDHAALAKRAQGLLDRFAVRPADPSAAAGALSGGNLQKLVAARELSHGPAAVVACYPTMGLDVSATAQVYETLFGLARDGAAVLWISEDLDDLLQHAHRIAVFFEGRVVRVLDAWQTSAIEVGGWMTGQLRAAADGAPAPRDEVLA
ncbi:MAG: ABC transporter ATP-binding protein [Rubrivivax sp.]